MNAKNRLDKCTDKEIIEEELGEHRDVLERLADLDTKLSDDAERVLEILDGGDQS
jgi:hypothetical protein